MMKFDMIIFDIDGVLVDVRKSYWEAIKQTVKSISGRTIGNEDMGRIKSIPGFNNDWTAAYGIIYGINDPENIDPQTKEYINVKSTFQAIYQRNKLSEMDVPLVSKEIFSKLGSGISLGVVTGRTRSEADSVIGKFFPKIFRKDFIIALEDCEKEKPDPEPLLLLKRRANTSAELYIGDTINDYLAAKSAGAIFLSVDSGIPADFYIQNLEELPNFLSSRISTLIRKTKETEITGSLNLDGSGKVNAITGIGFFDHMIGSFGKQGLFDIRLMVNGDLEVDNHHTVEDCGIALGQMFKEALADKRGINRYGFFILPMDETLALAAVDLDGRCKLVFDAEFRSENVGELETQLVMEFFEAFTRECRCSLNLKILDGINDHHKIEALFKAFGRALRMACEFDVRSNGEIASTKGVI